MKKKLAIIGGSYLQLPIVKKAKEMGIETHCFAWRPCCEAAIYLNRYVWRGDAHFSHCK